MLFVELRYPIFRFAENFTFIEITDRQMAASEIKHLRKSLDTRLQKMKKPMLFLATVAGMWAVYELSVIESEQPQTGSLPEAKAVIPRSNDSVLAYRSGAKRLENEKPVHNIPARDHRLVPAEAVKTETESGNNAYPSLDSLDAIEIENRLIDFESDFRQQPEDHQSTTDAEAELLQSLERSPVSDTVLDRVQCRQATCLVEFVHNKLEGREILLQRLSSISLFSRGFLVKTEESQEESRTLVYFPPVGKPFHLKLQDL